MEMAFLIGWVVGFATAGAGVVCLAALHVGRASDEDEGDGIQDDFTPALARWDRMGRKWGWL